MDGYQIFLTLDFGAKLFTSIGICSSFCGLLNWRSVFPAVDDIFYDYNELLGRETFYEHTIGSRFFNLLMLSNVFNKDNQVNARALLFDPLDDILHIG